MPDVGYRFLAILFSAAVGTVTLISENQLRSVICFSSFQEFVKHRYSFSASSSTSTAVLIISLLVLALVLVSSSCCSVLKQKVRWLICRTSLGTDTATYKCLSE